MEPPGRRRQGQVDGPQELRRPRCPRTAGRPRTSLPVASRCADFLLDLADELGGLLHALSPISLSPPLLLTQRSQRLDPKSHQPRVPRAEGRPHAVAKLPGQIHRSVERGVEGSGGLNLFLHLPGSLGQDLLGLMDALGEVAEVGLEDDS